MTDWTRRFIAVDWGTTNRRAYLLDANGTIVGRMEDDQGVTSVKPDGFVQAVEGISERLGNYPMLLAGMVGSNRGWQEAPYVECPVPLPALMQHLLSVDGGSRIVVPGLSYVEGARGDVMRGEEVQVFGLMAQEGPREAITVCHPGTHTKWVKTSGETISRFRTVMTGELLALLRDHSILAPLLRGATDPNAAFLKGVERGFAGADLGTELFALRAGALLNLLREQDALPLASGLLIGADLRSGLAWSGDDGQVIVLGSPSLTKLYAAGIEHVGRKCRCVDGGTAFVSGMHAIRRRLA